MASDQEPEMLVDYRTAQRLALKVPGLIAGILYLRTPGSGKKKKRVIIHFNGQKLLRNNVCNYT